jgi:hypothetical protein
VFIGKSLNTLLVSSATYISKVNIGSFGLKPVVCHQFQLFYSVMIASYSTLVHFLGQHSMQSETTGAIGRDSKVRGRQAILNLVALLIGVFFLICYQSALTVSLYESGRESDFQSIADVTSCKISAERICYPSGGADQTFWDEAIANRLQNNNCAVSNTTANKSTGALEDADPIAFGFSVLESGKGCDFYFTSGGATGSAVADKYCKTLVLVGSPFYPVGLSFVVPKGSPMLQQLTQETLNLKEQGLILTMEKFIDDNISTCKSANGESLTFNQLSVFFYISYGVLFVISIAMVVLRFYRRGEYPDQNNNAYANRATLNENPGPMPASRETGYGVSRFPSRGFAIPQPSGPPRLAGIDELEEIRAIGELPSPIPQSGQYAGLGYC